MEAGSFFEWILRSSSMGTVLALVILAVKYLFKNKLDARWHHYIWLLLLIRLVLPYAPESSLSLFNFIPTHEIVSVGDVADSSPLPVNLPGESPGQVAAPGENPNIPVEPPSRNPVVEPATTINLLTVFYWLWLIGVILLGLYTLIINANVWFKHRSDTPITDPKVLGIYEESKRKMGIRKNVPLMETGSLSTPALFGIIRLRLLLPVGLSEKLTPDELSYVFMHELAHFKRKDLLIYWVSGILQILHWFNPVLWYSFYRMRQDCEPACDALVLAHIEPLEFKLYGGTIIKLMDIVTGPLTHPGVIGIVEDKSQIKRRISAIAMFKRNPFVSATALIIILVLGVFLLTNAINPGNRLTRFEDSVDFLLFLMERSREEDWDTVKNYLVDSKGYDLKVIEAMMQNFYLYGHVNEREDMVAEEYESWTAVRLQEPAVTLILRKNRGTGWLYDPGSFNRRLAIRRAQNTGGSLPDFNKYVHSSVEYDDSIIELVKDAGGAVRAIETQRDGVIIIISLSLHASDDLQNVHLPMGELKWFGNGRSGNVSIDSSNAYPEGSNLLMPVSPYSEETEDVKRTAGSWVSFKLHGAQNEETVTIEIPLIINNVYKLVYYIEFIVTDLP